MCKFIALFICMILLYHIAESQPITLRDSGFVLISNDTCAFLKDRRYASLLGQPKINGTWDMSLINYEYPIGYYQRQAPLQTGIYPNVSYVYSQGNVYGGTLQAVTSYYSVDSSGIMCLGQHSLDRQAYSQGNTTGNPADSIIFPPQKVPYSPALKQIVFPTTMNSLWNNAISYTNQAAIYSQKGSLVNATMTISTHWSLADTIVGWGKMRVRMPDSTRLSDYVPVLQVHESRIKTDSFWIAGVLAPDSILTYLGLVQGNITSFYSTKFLRAGEIEPLFTAFYSGPDYYLPLQAFTVPMRVSSSQQSTSIPYVTSRELCIYPNPSRLRDIMVAWPGSQNLEYRYALTNFQGQNVITGTLYLNQLLHLPVSLPAGIYCLSIFQAEGNKISVPLSLE